MRYVGCTVTMPSSSYAMVKVCRLGLCVGRPQALQCAGAGWRSPGRRAPLLSTGGAQTRPKTALWRVLAVRCAEVVNWCARIEVPRGAAGAAQMSSAFRLSRMMPFFSSVRSSPRTCKAGTSPRCSSSSHLQA